MYEHIEKYKEVKYIREYQTELRDKEYNNWPENALDFSIRLDAAEEWKSELEDKAFVIHTKSNGNKKL